MTKYPIEDFKQLQREWYKRLEDTGFEDIEDKKTRDKKHFRNKSKEQYQAHEEYFYRIQQILYNADIDFRNEADRFILTRHAQGISISDIVKGLKAINMSRDRKNVRLIIRRYIIKWGIINE